MVTTDDELISEVTEGWSLNTALSDTKTFMRGLNLPVMKQPTGLDKEYDFPSDVNHLKSEQLGTLQLSLGGWYSYLLGIIGSEESGLGAFEEVFSVKLGVAMKEEKLKISDVKGTISVEILRGVCIAEIPELNRLHKSLITRRHRVQSLKAQAEVYRAQLERLSREQARRESEARRFGV